MSRTVDEIPGQSAHVFLTIGNRAWQHQNKIRAAKFGRTGENVRPKSESKTWIMVLLMKTERGQLYNSTPW